MKNLLGLLAIVACLFMATDAIAQCPYAAAEKAAAKTTCSKKAAATAVAGESEAKVVNAAVQQDG